MQIFLFYKDTTYIIELVIFNDICNNPISKEGHILRYLRLGLQHVYLGGTQFNP